MYIVVQHQVIDAAKFWPADIARFAMMVPPHLKHLTTLAAVDGTQAVCVWEADSVDTLRDWLDPATAGASTNAYFAAVNKEGIALPPPRVAAQRA